MSKKKRQERKEKRKEKKEERKANKQGGLGAKITSAVLRPFKKPMLKLLKSRGVKDVNANSPMLAIALSFYNNIARKSKDSYEADSFESDFDSYEYDTLDEMQASKAAAVTIAAGGALAAPTGGISLIVAPLVAAVLKWFAKKKQDAKDGKNISPDEADAVDEAEKELKGGGGGGDPKLGGFSVSDVNWNSPIEVFAVILKGSFYAGVATQCLKQLFNYVLQ